MKYSRKIAAIILSLIMTLTMMPAAAFADEESLAGEATAADETGEQVISTEAAQAAQDETALEEISESTDAGESEDIANDVAAESADGVSDTDADLPDNEDCEGSDDEECDDEEYDESDMGEAELSFSQGIDADELEGADPETLMEDFLLDDEGSSDDNGSKTLKSLSVKGDRLTGNNLIFYNNFKSIISSVSAGKTTNSYKAVKLSNILGKRTFTAKELGVSKIGYKKNGKWYVTSAAQKKINALLSAEDWKKVYQSLLSDMSSESYWVDWYSSSQFLIWNCTYNYNKTSLTFKSSDTITFCLPVMPEFAKAKDSTHNYVYQADSSKISGANTAKANAKKIVQTFDSAVSTTFAGYSDAGIDVNRLWYYAKVIAEWNSYDHESATDPSNVYWRGPWSLIYVFDGNTSTNAVCAGYARAFKYLCDLSTFKSDWIDCQIVTGSAGATDSSHMWNIVRMNDGLNYVVDPTWIDTDTEGTYNDSWFLRGAPGGTADSFTIEGNTRVYDEWTKSVFAPAERKLSTKSNYEWVSNKAISLIGSKIKKLKKGKKSFKVTWNKVTTPLGALYVDGYQIQYSLKKNFKKSKTVTVKGYNQSSKTIKKLKSKKKYYVRVRTYAKVGKHTYYSAWSAKKKVKTK